MDDDEIRAVVTRLARPHPAGGEVIERAAILAEGSDAGAVIAWIIAHAGEFEAAAQRPRAAPPTVSAGGEMPLRFVFPPGALA